MKQCSKCKEGKELDQFVKNKKSKDGKRSSCKECNFQCKKQGYEKNKEHVKQCKKQYQEKNKEYLKQYNKQYQEDNKEYVKQLRKQGNENNKKYAKQSRKRTMSSPISGNKNTKPRNEIELYEEIKESQNGNVECRCAYCGEGFEPTRWQIQNRLKAINGEIKGELRLYCSDKCKENCPIYWQMFYEKGQQPTTSREVQPQLRQEVFERDNYTCQKCNIHKDNLQIGIHCHHIDPLNENPVESADKDNCITLCEDCHKEVHQIPGCTLSELKCA